MIIIFHGFKIKVMVFLKSKQELFVQYYHVFWCVDGFRLNVILKFYTFCEEF